MLPHFKMVKSFSLALCFVPLCLSSSSAAITIGASAEIYECRARTPKHTMGAAGLSAAPPSGWDPRPNPDGPIPRRLVNGSANDSKRGRDFYEICSYVCYSSSSMNWKNLQIPTYLPTLGYQVWIGGALLFCERLHTFLGFSLSLALF